MEQEDAQMDFCVEVVGVFGKKQRINLCDTEEKFQTVTVEQLKKKIMQVLSSRSRDWPKYIELFFENKKLVDSTLLRGNGIKRQSIIYMALVYSQKKSVMKNDDGEARASADEEERCKQEEMKTIQVLVCVSDEEKVMAVLCVTKEEMMKMTVEQLERKIEMNVMIGEFRVKVDEMYFNGNQLEETSLLSDRGVQHMSTVEATIVYLYKGETCSGSLTEHAKGDEKRFSMEYFGDFEKTCGPFMY